MAKLKFGYAAGFQVHTFNGNLLLGLLFATVYLWHNIRIHWFSTLWCLDLMLEGTEIVHRKD